MFNHYAGTPNLGMEYRPYFLGLNWLKSGHNLTIVSSSYSHSRKSQPSQPFFYKKETIDGINYIWVYGNKYKGNGFTRALNILIYSFLSCFVFFYIRKNFNILINSSTHTLDIFPLLLYKYFCKLFFKSKKIISVFEPHDLWPMVLTEIGKMSKFHPFVLINSLGEKLSCLTSDLIISMHPGNIEHLKKRGAKQKNFFHIPNGINTSDNFTYNNLPIEIENKLKSLKRKSRKIIMYTGTISVANNLEFLISAIPEVKDKISLVFFGKGTQLEILKKKCFELDVDAYFFNNIDKQQVPSALKYSDICYVGFIKNILYQYGISPNKLWDYMMASKPIILCVSSCNDPVKEANCGITVSSYEQNDLVKAIESLCYLDENKLNQIGLNGKKYVMKNNSYEKISEDIIKIFSRKLNSIDE